jgi:peptidoglycan hydrolase FlgJ
MDVNSVGAIGAPPKVDRQAILMEKAKGLETAFLAEMLGHAGIDADETSAFSGGHGEEQFASFLRQEQARLMVEKGGIGLAEALFRAMGGVDETA